jgi:hypothetical protein
MNLHDKIKQCFVMFNSVRLGNFTCKFFASCASGYQTKEAVMGRTCNTVGEITNGQTCELGNFVRTSTFGRRDLRRKTKIK